MLGTLALIKGGGALANWAWNKYQNKGGFRDTDLAKRLKQIQERGAITSAMRSKAIGGTARTAGAIASRERTGLRGRLISQSMEGSIAGVRAQKDIGTGYMDAVAGTAREVDLMNEQSKIDAANQYAQQQYAFSQQQKAADAANNAQLISGIVDAGVGYVGGKIQQKQLAQQLDVDKQKKAAELIAKMRTAQRQREFLKGKYEAANQTRENIAGMKLEAMEPYRQSQINLNEARVKEITDKINTGYYQRGGSGSSDQTGKDIDDLMQAMKLYQPRYNTFGEMVNPGNPEMLRIIEQSLLALQKKRGQVPMMYEYSNQSGGINPADLSF
jgi:mannose/fructose/N-acetylgalactosamine-specific phosphotransferase system component IIB